MQCSGTVEPSLLSSCQNIVDTMSASRDFTTWGPHDDPLAVVKLPLIFHSREFIRFFLPKISALDDQADRIMHFRGWKVQNEHSHGRADGYVFDVPVLDRGGGADGDMRQRWAGGDAR